jgi:hypothetical protein
VEVFPREDGLVVVYLFPLSAEITKKDGLVEFVGRIGRIGLTQYFNAAEMQFQGRLALQEAQRPIRSSSLDRIRKTITYMAIGKKIARVDSIVTELFSQLMHQGS